MEEKKEKSKMKEIKKWLQAFYSELWTDEEEVLQIVKNERSIWDDYMNAERLEIEADLVLLRNQKKQKNKIWDTTLFNVHTALIARSFQAKTPIKFKWDKNWIEKEIKMLNTVFKEDNESTYMKALRYYQLFDIYACGVSITAKVGWNWVYKRNMFNVINPLLAVPDPNGDYFTWNYRFIWFSSIKTKEQLEADWYEEDDLNTGQSVQWALQQKNNTQTSLWMPSIDTEWLYEVYLHFTHVENRKVWVLTANNEQIVLNAWLVPAWNKYQEKNPEAIEFPLSFKYWKPLRDKFCGDRPANYTRDVQINKATIANLRIDKMRAELYPMYLYNKDYVNGKDLDFGFNKWIPISTWINWPQVNLQNLVSPVMKDLRIDTSIQVDQLMDNQVEKSTSIWAVAQWTTPDRKETLWTNQLVQTNTDVNLSLNEEIQIIWEEKFVIDWFAWYYQNFNDADKKLVYAWLGTGTIPLKIKRKDFIYEGNLAISIETNIQSENRKKKQALAYQITWPLILQDQSINEGSKRATLRRIAEANGIDEEAIDIEIPITSQQRLQQLENDLLMDGQYIDINPDDDDEAHLIEMWSLILTPEMEMHQYAHIQASIKKGKPQQQTQDTWMLNSMSNVAVNQASQQQAQTL